MINLEDIINKESCDTAEIGNTKLVSRHEEYKTLLDQLDKYFDTRKLILDGLDIVTEIVASNKEGYLDNDIINSFKETHWCGIILIKKVDLISSLCARQSDGFSSTKLSRDELVNIFKGCNSEINKFLNDMRTTTQRYIDQERSRKIT